MREFSLDWSDACTEYLPATICDRIIFACKGASRRLRARAAMIGQNDALIGEQPPVQPWVNLTCLLLFSQPIEEFLPRYDPHIYSQCSLVPASSDCSYCGLRDELSSSSKNRCAPRSAYKASRVVWSISRELS